MATSIALPSNANLSTNDSGGLLVSSTTGLGVYNTSVWILLYSVSVLLSAFCNLAALAVLLKGRHCKTDLRPFLVSLACSDLQMGIFCIPFTSTYTLMQFDWIFPQAICKMVLFMQYAAVSSSVFTNIAIGVDRLVAVISPLRSRLEGRRTKVALVVIWVAAVGLSSVQFYVGDKFYDPISSSWRCEEKHWPEPQATYSTVYTWFLFSVTYAIPLSILTVTYSVVGCKLWFHAAPGNANAERDSRQVKAKIKLVKMLATIVICFGLNWLPIYLFFILKDVPQIGELFASYPTVALNTYNCCHWMAMSNSFCNFWIYLFMNKAFRIDFLALICRYKKQRYDRQWTGTGFHRSVSPAQHADKEKSAAARHLGSLNGGWKEASAAAELALRTTVRAIGDTHATSTDESKEKNEELNVLTNTHVSRLSSATLCIASDASQHILHGHNNSNSNSHSLDSEL